MENSLDIALLSYLFVSQGEIMRKKVIIALIILAIGLLGLYCRDRYVMIRDYITIRGESSLIPAESSEYTIEVLSVEEVEENGVDGDGKKCALVTFKLQNRSDKAIELPVDNRMTIEYRVWGKWYQESGGYNSMLLPDRDVLEVGEEIELSNLIWPGINVKMPADKGKPMQLDSIWKGRYRILWEVEEGICVADEFTIR